MVSLTAPAGAVQQPAIKDYAIIGDCRTAALVSRQGSIDWLCLPNFSDASVFGRLIDRDGGHFSIRPCEPFHSTRRYIDGTAVLQTTFRSDKGVARLTDFFPVVDSANSLEPMREIVRIVECLEGTIALDIEFAPRPGYGKSRVRLNRYGPFVWRLAWSARLLILRCDTDLTPHGKDLRGVIHFEKGTRRYFSLSYVGRDVATIPSLGHAADRRASATVAWWKKWSEACRYGGPEREAVLRSAITLKLLTFCLSGAIVAAPTTSLPETPGNTRNWDYRYCWLRDAGLTMTALTELGYHDEAAAYLDWLLHATRLTRPDLSILYDVYGRTNLRERNLDRLSGYRGARPVRTGNNAMNQFQLDVHGQVIASAEAFSSAGFPLDSTKATMLAQFGDAVCQKWLQSDNGIWEIPDPRRQYTFSKVMCWVALDKLLTLHDRGSIHLGKKARKFQTVRDQISDCIERRGFHAGIGTYTSELDGRDVDAALLFMVSFGYCNAADPRMVATYERIRKELGNHVLVRRYRPGYDGLVEEAGSFGICSYLAVVHLAKRGMIDEAERHFMVLSSFANDVGLFGEEIEPGSGRAFGNYPQAFTHVGQIYAALSIAKAREQSAMRPTG